MFRLIVNKSQTRITQFLYTSNTIKTSSIMIFLLPLTNSGNILSEKESNFPIGAFNKCLEIYLPIQSRFQRIISTNYPALARRRAK